MTAISKFEADYNANLVKMQLTTDPTDWYNKTKLPRLRCHKFTFAEPPDPKKTSVIVTPGKSVVHEWLYGPATVLETRTVIYPCVRNRCSVPCRCLICLKCYPKCRVPMSKGCSCDDCSLHFEDHSQFHRTFKFGCKWCFQLENIFPHFNFFFLEA